MCLGSCFQTGDRWTKEGAGRGEDEEQGLRPPVNIVQASHCEWWSHQLGLDGGVGIPDTQVEEGVASGSQLLAAGQIRLGLTDSCSLNC